MGAREPLEKQQQRATTPEGLAASIVLAGSEELLSISLDRARVLGLRWPEPLLTLSMRLLPPQATLRQVLDDAAWWREVAKRRVPIGGPLGHIGQWFDDLALEEAMVRTIPDDVRAWAIVRGVVPALDLIFDGLAAAARAEGEERVRVAPRPGLTVGEVLDAEPISGDIMDRASRALAWQKVATEARDRVRALAEEQQPAPKPPEDARAKLLFDALGGLRATIRAVAWPRPRERTRRGALNGPDKLAAASIRLTYVDAERIYRGDVLRSPEVSMVIRDLEATGIDVSCNCTDDRVARCTHALAAVDDLRAMLSGAPWGFARSIIALLEELSRPLEIRVDRVLEQLVSRASLGDEEVAFGWIVSDVHGIQLQPAVQRRGKRGHLLQPRRATAADLAAMPRHLLSPMDTVLLDTTVAPKSHGVSASLGGTDALRSIERLIGHPRIWHDGQWERPLDVRRAVIEVSLGAREDGRIALGVALDGKVLEGSSLLALLDELEDGRAAWLDLARGTLSVLAIDPDTITLLELAVATAHALPSDARARIEPALGALVARLPIALGEGFRGPAVEAQYRPTVRLAMLDSGGVHVSLVVRPLDGCVPQAPGDGPDILIGRGPNGPIHTVRDRARERTEAAALGERLGLTSAHSAGERVESVERALEVVEALRLEPEIEVEWSSPRKMRIRGMPRDAKIQLAVTTSRDWFGVKGKIALDETVLELAAVIEALRRGETYVKVGPDEWMRIDEALRARLQPLVDAASIDRGQLTVPRVSARALLPIIEEADDAEVAPELSAMMARVAEAEAFDITGMTPRITAELRSYQLEGWAWLTRLSMWGAGACLADDMGLGKTIQALAVLAERGARGPQIVIAPTSVVGNWRRETARFAPDLRAVVYREGDRREILARLGPGDLLLASYGILVRDAEALSSIAWTTLVLDEAQAVKNADTQRAKAARGLNADWRLALTGTPIENHLGELWSLFDLVSPGLLGKEREFKERFITPIERSKDSERRLALARLVRPFVLRRTKSEVARDLPPRTEMTLEVELSSAEAQLYEDARRAAVARVGGLVTESEQSRFQVLAEIMRLRQLACHPRLVYPDETATSSKMETALALIDTLRREGHRALVFSQFTRHLALLRAALDEAKVPYLYLDGSTPALEREKRVERFQAGEGELFLISLKAGGTGLNLTGADYVIHLDPWWNPSVEDQATDRAHRIGQTRPVTVYRLIAKATIEERILALHAEKRALVASVLEGSDAAATLDTEALIDLITEGAPRTPRAVVIHAPPPAAPVAPPPLAKPKPVKVRLPRVLGEDPGGLAELAAAFVEASGENKDPVMAWFVDALSGPAGTTLHPGSEYDAVMDALRAGPLRDAGSPDGRSVRARLRRLWSFGEAILEDV